jgi:hypothetical protein
MAGGISVCLQQTFCVLELIGCLHSPSFQLFLKMTGSDNRKIIYLNTQKFKS